MTEINYKTKCPDHPNNDGLICGLCHRIRQCQIKEIKRYEKQIQELKQFEKMYLNAKEQCDVFTKQIQDLKKCLNINDKLRIKEFEELVKLRKNRIGLCCNPDCHREARWCHKCYENKKEESK